ncbi:MAG: phage tail sheath subtilisin-like domain-containing protein [Clostridiales Family XIII bacterium]|jgi:phage tail sheath protein FI|nr:phage tail sheath subtilisin-like domain-containing protein [Clostridiales Family XIII bacterium]
MAEYLSPGVYVEEFDSGPVPMEGVGTSTAGFIGLAVKGPVGGAPQLVTGVADFRRAYGGYLSANEFGDYRFLAYAVEHFFTNGGTRAYIARVAPPDAKKATSAAESPLKLRASSVGAWGNELKAVFSPAGKAKTQIFDLISPKRIRVKNNAGFNAGDVIVLTDGETKSYNRVVKSQDNVIDLLDDFDESVVDKALSPKKILSTCEFNLDIYHDDVAESYSNLSLNINIPEHIGKKLSRSALVSIELAKIPEDASPPYALLVGEEKATEKSVSVTFGGGSNGSAAAITADVFMGEDNGPGKRTGIQAFIDNSVVSIMAVPGNTDPNVQLTLVAHCENLKSRFAVLDMPPELTKPDDLLVHRELFDTSYAALYHPWLQVFDPLDKRGIFIPPSGSVVGIYARSDASRGVHKAPGNETVRSCTGLSVSYNKGEQDILNPKGVNLIRAIPGSGINVWGVRTASSNNLWKYVNVRRLFIYVEESIKANTNWVVFEPNDEALWSRVERTIASFLTTLWRDGALQGATPAEAFYVVVGRSTMSQDDIDNGRLICEIGIAAVKPAEFVIFKVTQNTATE